MRKIFLLAAVFMIMFSSIAQALSPKISEWWEGEMLTAVGQGVAPINAPSVDKAKFFAKRAATLDAYRKLAAQVSEIKITADKTMLKSTVNAVIHDAEIISEDYDDSGKYTVVLRVPIYGVDNSVAAAAFERVEKENFPPPTENKIAQGNYTGLIIDCGDLELNPVLAPAIRNADNQSIYGYSNLDYDKVISKGMIGYVKKNSVMLLNSTGAKKFAQVGSNLLLADNDDTSRAGSNPLIIKAAALSDDNSCPVISTEDADKILAENLSTHFLDEGSVVFTSNRIRGLRM